MFVGIVTRIVPSSFSDNSQLVSGNTNWSLFAVSVSQVLLSCSLVSEDDFILCYVKEIIIKDSLIFFFLNLDAFCLFLAPLPGYHLQYSTLLNKTDESKNPGLVLSLGRAYNVLSYVPSVCTDLLGSFLHEGFLNSLQCSFCICLNNCPFVVCHINVVDHV